ncbi:MAG: hypothetical protein ACYDHH_17480 [Solirubrobacteraceae bacterium]
MLEQTIPRLVLTGERSVLTDSGPPRAPARFSPLRNPWVIGTVLLIAISAVLTSIAAVKPAFDAYGWLVWGRQALHLSLNTDSAPSWKPLPFLFTLPYALLGRAALWLWMTTVLAGSLAAGVFAARIAHRLTSDCARYARVAAAAFAALGVLGIEGYSHFVLIGYSDPMLVTLTLAAIDARLSGRPRLAWWLLVLLSLGRPEAWPVTALYGAWLWRSESSDRPLRRPVAVGIAAIPLAWFVIPAVTSPSWLIAGDVASRAGAHSGGLIDVLDRFASLYELPMQLAVLLALALALVRRDGTALILTAGAIVWIATEVAFALHGWPAVPRYMFEPAAVLVVLAAVGIGQLLSLKVRSRPARLVGLAIVLAIVGTLVPHARLRVRLVDNGVKLGQNWSLQLNRLHDVIAKIGGSRAVLSCGRAVSTIPYQPVLAWELGLNIYKVGYIPAKAIRRHRATVLFTPVYAGWSIRPIHIPRSKRARCSRLRADTATSSIRGAKVFHLPN